MENTSLLVKLLFDMCKVQVVEKTRENELNKINHNGIMREIEYVGTEIVKIS